ncbi:Predicted nucleic-acid-binding protein, contains PIN domain [Caldanaerobius fijiensis DSM 17918]|uniref:Predicted nucleic-acid-binding protein, contains PIN domain n=1 Tax=Caldanaerobius fijiensis DSM 17918 TaxID=1121256 RepID=A0A1M5AHG0_9THEO|nr:PIN domain-containing protein [Caldanaerobius fijiensis]SHF29575.1 Predicted nucleic-acid-binding protein, contains PIN domain [Caldanaerobius fijiensis DSM 17918]
MVIIDANIALRYLLDDVPELANKAAEVLENNEIYIPNEVFAEIIYVLEKIYKIEREEIASILGDFIQIDNINVTDINLLLEALKLYKVRTLDFVDTLLYSYKKLKKYEVCTFDQKLKKLIENLGE